MKKIFLVLALVAGTLSAQIAHNSNMVMRTATDTLKSAVSAYSDGQVIRGTTSNAITLSLAIPRYNNLDTTGWIYWSVLEMDSVSTGDIDMIVLSDTLGLWLSLVANHGVFKDTGAIAAYFVARISHNLASSGTLKTRSSNQFFHPYAVRAKKTRLYGIPVAKSAYTPKLNGVVKWTLYMAVE
jgi:hypothetical protein